MEAKRQPSARGGPDPMRLTPEQAAIIRSTAAEVFGSDARVWLSGSRVDDSKRGGGDIDLYLETAQTSSSAVRRQAHAMSGERYRGFADVIDWPARAFFLTSSRMARTPYFSSSRTARSAEPGSSPRPLPRVMSCRAKGFCCDRKISISAHGRFRGDQAPILSASAARIVAPKRMARTRSVRGADMDRGGVDAFCTCQGGRTGAGADGIARLRACRGRPGNP